MYIHSENLTLLKFVLTLTASETFLNFDDGCFFKTDDIAVAKNSVPRSCAYNFMEINRLSDVTYYLGLPDAGFSIHHQIHYSLNYLWPDYFSFAASDPVPYGQCDYYHADLDSDVGYSAYDFRIMGLTNDIFDSSKLHWHYPTGSYRPKPNNLHKPHCNSMTSITRNGVFIRQFKSEQEIDVTSSVTNTCGVTVLKVHFIGIRTIWNQDTNQAVTFALRNGLYYQTPSNKHYVPGNEDYITVTVVSSVLYFSYRDVEIFSTNGIFNIRDPNLKSITKDTLYTDAHNSCEDILKSEPEKFPRSRYNLTHDFDGKFIVRGTDYGFNRQGHDLTDPKLPWFLHGILVVVNAFVSLFSNALKSLLTDLVPFFSDLLRSFFPLIEEVVKFLLELIFDLEELLVVFVQRIINLLTRFIEKALIPLTSLVHTIIRAAYTILQSILNIFGIPALPLVVCYLYFLKDYGFIGAGISSISVVLICVVISKSLKFDYATSYN